MVLHADKGQNGDGKANELSLGPGILTNGNSQPIAGGKAVNEEQDGRTGIVDGKVGDYGAHVIQTPGKVTTIAEVSVPGQATDVKVQLPSGQSDGENSASDDANHGLPSSLLLGQPGRPGDVANLQPVAEVSEKYLFARIQPD